MTIRGGEGEGGRRLMEKTILRFFAWLRTVEKVALHLAGLVLMASSSTEWSTLGNWVGCWEGRQGGGKEVVGEVQGRVEEERSARKSRSRSRTRRRKHWSRRRRRSMYERRRNRSRSRRRRKSRPGARTHLHARARAVLLQWSPANQIWIRIFRELATWAMLAETVIHKSIRKVVPRRELDW